MSRIGIQPIEIKQGITIEVKDGSVKVKGPKGELAFNVPEKISVEVKDNETIVNRKGEEKKVRAMHGTIRALIVNMIEGVSEGYEKELELVGIGYRAKLSGKNLEISLGFSHPVIVEAPEGISFEVPTETEIKVSGIDKQKVGEVAAKIRSLRKPEPYKGKGVRYKGEHITIKQPRAIGGDE